MQRRWRRQGVEQLVSDPHFAAVMDGALFRSLVSLSDVTCYAPACTSACQFF